MLRDHEAMAVFGTKAGVPGVDIRVPLLELRAQGSCSTSTSTETALQST